MLRVELLLLRALRRVRYSLRLRTTWSAESLLLVSFRPSNHRWYDSTLHYHDTIERATFRFI